MKRLEARASGGGHPAAKAAAEVPSAGVNHAAARAADVRSRVRRSRPVTLGALFLAIVAVLALAANFLASDLPYLCKVHGRVHVLPNLFTPSALAGEGGRDKVIAAAAAGDGWAVSTPISFGP